MKGDKIPNHDHIARYCKPITVEDGQIQATAFMVRTGEESLSVNWLEFLNCSSSENEIAELRKIYSRKFNKVGMSAKIAMLNIGEVCEKVLTKSPDRRKLEVLHAPIENDPSHSEIYNLKQDDELIAELILELVCETYSARI